MGPITDADKLAIDRLIAKHVMGWEFVKPRHGWCCTCQRCGRHYDDCDTGRSCRFSDDMAEAWPVVEAMRDKGFDVVLYNSGAQWGCTMLRDGNVMVADPIQDTAAEAICVAALFALGITPDPDRPA